MQGAWTARGLSQQALQIGVEISTHKRYVSFMADLDGTYSWREIYKHILRVVGTTRDLEETCIYHGHYRSAEYAELMNIAAGLVHKIYETKETPGRQHAIEALLKQIAAIRANPPKSKLPEFSGLDKTFLDNLETAVLKKRDEIRARAAACSRRRREVKRMEREPAHCEACGELVAPTRADAKTCSHACRQRLHRLRHRAAAL